MSKIETPESLKEAPLAVIKNIISLSTSGFGVVVALAWNEVIKKAVTQYIDPFLGKDSGMISMLIYAVAMTLLAVFITMQLGSLQRNLEKITISKIAKPTKLIKKKKSKK